MLGSAQPRSASEVVVKACEACLAYLERLSADKGFKLASTEDDIAFEDHLISMRIMLVVYSPERLAQSKYHHAMKTSRGENAGLCVSSICQLLRTSSDWKTWYDALFKRRGEFHKASGNMSAVREALEEIQLDEDEVTSLDASKAFTGAVTVALKAIGEAMAAKVGL